MIERTVDQWADRIRPHLAGAVENIVTVGRDLLAAKEALPHGQFTPLLSRLGLTRQTANRFMRVAANPVIANRSPVSGLPPAVSVLDVLTQLPPHEIEEAIAAGAITASTTRHQASELVRRRVAGDTDVSPETFLEEVSKNVARVVMETDAGFYGPPAETRAHQRDISDLLVLCWRERRPDMDRTIEEIRGLLGTSAWASGDDWVTALGWIASLDEPDIASPWSQQLLAGDADDLMTAARTWVFGSNAAGGTSS